MPSPIGHAVAGCAVVWAADLIDRRPSSARLALAGAVLATTPDLDLLFAHFHRSATHSAVAVVLVFSIAAAVTGKVTRWRTAAICAAAYATHLLLDWLATDRFAPAGIQIWWPFAPRFYLSGWDIFDQTERLHPFAPATIDQNARAVAKEIAYLAPIAAALWLIRIRTLRRRA
jgi:membrane-bound metal-dependent hydrolase YbcI (DUF457 family)